MIESFDISYIVTSIDVVAALIESTICFASLPSGSTMIVIAVVPCTFASAVIVAASIPSSPPPPSPVVPCGEPHAASARASTTGRMARSVCSTLPRCPAKKY